MICPIDESGYCSRHFRKHIGHAARIAVDPSEAAAVKRRLWDGYRGDGHATAPAKKLLRSLPLAKTCLHYQGTNAPDKPGCGACSTWNCAINGKVKPTYCVSECGDWKSKVENSNTTFEISIQHSRPSIRLDQHNLFPTIPGIRFNSSLIESGADYIFGFRNGWRGSNIYACRLDKDFKPYGECKKLNLGKKGSNIGREDCRWFRLNGKLHIWFIGYTGITNVKFARVNEETLEVEDCFFPQLTPRNPMEKNWAMFDYQGIVHAVYDTKPNHRIIRIEGDKAEHAYSTPFQGHWSGGPMRGGASPVLHNGEFWHWFHGCYSIKGRRRYCTGVTVFRAEPPFDVLRYTPHPIDQAEIESRSNPDVDVLFVGSAFYKNGEWITANGIHDRWSELRFYDASWIEQQLVDA